MPASAGAISGAASQTMGMWAGTFQILDSVKKEKQAAKELSRLKPAFYKIQDEYFQNKNLAEGMAMSGLPQSSKDYADIERQRGLSTGIGALVQSGASPNDISQLLGTYNLSVDRTAAEDAQAKLENIKYFMNTNKDLAGQKTIQWSYNEELPYERKLKDITKRREAAEANKWAGLNLAIGATSALGTGMANQDVNPIGGGDAKSSAYNKLFNSGGAKPGISNTNTTNDQIEAIFNQLYGFNP